MDAGLTSINSPKVPARFIPGGDFRLSAYSRESEKIVIVGRPQDRLILIKKSNDFDFELMTLPPATL
jgi:hypothetical protein